MILVAKLYTAEFRQNNECSCLKDKTLNLGE